jgi:DNA-binding CsgD family transcriptional regulator
MLRESPAAVSLIEDGAPEGSWSDGMAALPAATPAIATLADAVARCHGIAAGIGATGFSLLFTAAQGEARRLVPVFDSAFPGLSALSRALSSASADGFAAQVAARAAPLWWRGGGETDMLHADARVWAQEAPSPLAGTALADQPGIVFPVARENGRAGAVAFYGVAISLGVEALCDAHARCLALFVEVARQRPMTGARLPSMSKREIECLRLTANGLTSEEIAAELGLSVHTANQYLTSSAQKLNAVNRIHAVAKALRAGLID